jgi:hypothetical protein
MKTILSAQAGFTLILALSQTACDNPKYEAVDITSDDNPSLKFHFSAADATRSAPVVMTVPGRELTVDDGKYRVRLQRHWVAIHVPRESSLLGMGSAMCGLKREGEFPHCDVMIIELPGTKKPVEYYFYLGNWK